MPVNAGEKGTICVTEGDQKTKKPHEISGKNEKPHKLWAKFKNRKTRQMLRKTEKPDENSAKTGDPKPTDTPHLTSRDSIIQFM